MNGINNKRALKQWSWIDAEEIHASDLNRFAESFDNNRPMRPMRCKVQQLPGQRIIRPLRRD